MAGLATPSVVQKFRQPACSQSHQEQVGGGSGPSFNGRLRDELLNETLFMSLAEARAALAAWMASPGHARAGRGAPGIPLGFVPVAITGCGGQFAG